MTPRLYTSVSRHLYSGRTVLLLVVAGLIALAIAAPAAARRLLALGMLIWGLAMAAYGFHPDRGPASGIGARRAVVGWIAAVGLNLWFALSLYWFVV